jgi:hypothetical protein
MKLSKFEEPVESYTQTVEARLDEATTTIRTLTREHELLRINHSPYSNSNESNSNVNSNINISNVGNHGQASHFPANNPGQANNPVTVIINNGEKESPLHREILERLTSLENQHAKHVPRENPNISLNLHSERSHSATRTYDDSTPYDCDMVIGDKPGYATQSLSTSSARTPLAVPQKARQSRLFHQPLHILRRF